MRIYHLILCHTLKAEVSWPSQMVTSHVVTTLTLNSKIHTHFGIKNYYKTHMVKIPYFRDS